MKAVVQRVTEAKLSVGGDLISQIGLGFVVYFGVAEGDDKEKADFLAKKIGGLRVFEDDRKSKMPRTVPAAKTITLLHNWWGISLRIVPAANLAP